MKLAFPECRCIHSLTVFRPSPQFGRGAFWELRNAALLTIDQWQGLRVHADIRFCKRCSVVGLCPCGNVLGIDPQMRSQCKRHRTLKRRQMLDSILDENILHRYGCGYAMVGECTGECTMSCKFILTYIRFIFRYILVVSRPSCYSLLACILLFLAYGHVYRDKFPSSSSCSSEMAVWARPHSSSAI